MKIDILTSLLPAGRKRGVVLTGGAAFALLGGNKLAACMLLARGVANLEQAWVADHPHWDGTWSDRLAHALAAYERSHTDPINRRMHRIGLPMIVGGTVGLLAFRTLGPLWLISAGSFVAGCTLNAVGHSAYEGSPLAFATDPMAFVIGPIWDWQERRAAAAAAETTPHIDFPHGAEPVMA